MAANNKTLYSKAEYKRSNSYYVTKYGITRDAYIAMATAQENKCAICGRTKHWDDPFDD